MKATVDAYDGSVTLYAWDDEDPMLQAWQKVYPTTLEPISEMSGDLMSHVRYPTDLFKVQRAMLGVVPRRPTPSRSTQRDDAWATPNDPQHAEHAPAAAVLPDDADAGPGRARVLDVHDASSRIRGRQQPQRADGLPRGRFGRRQHDGRESDGLRQAPHADVPDDDTTSRAPVRCRTRSTPTRRCRNQLNILQQGQSEVLNGNLLTLPVGGGLLYVQPVFVQSHPAAPSYPLLQKVLVAFGDQIAFEDTLDQALDVLFGGDSGADAGDNEVEPGAEPTTPPEGEPTTPTTPNEEIQALLNQASQALKNKQAALSEGDWAAYGAADAQLAEIIAKLLQATATEAPTEDASTGG